MRKVTIMIFSISAILTFAGCAQQKNASELPNSHPPSIMVDGELYTTTGQELPIEPAEGEAKTVTSLIMATKLPSKEGEINFPNPDAKYAKIYDQEEYVVVMMDKEWVKFEKRESWGLELTATKIEPTGLTIEFHQSGGNPKGDLQTGSYYSLETEVDKKWVPVEIRPSVHDVAWTMEAYSIRKNDTTELETDWTWLYGELPEGSYRIGKEIMDFKGTGSYDIENYFAYFEIEK